MRLLIFFLLLPVFASAQVVTDTVIDGRAYTFLDVCFLAGQSNSGVQNSNADTLTAKYRTRQGGVYLWRGVAGRPEPYFAEEGNVEYDAQSEYGYGLVFGREYYEDTGRPILIVKHSVGGTKLGSSTLAGGDTWDPAETNDLYDQAIDKWEAAKAYYFARGIVLRVVVVIWAQGEADASVQTLADTYGVNLPNFMATLESDLDFSGQWIMTLLRANTTRCCESTVRAVIATEAAAGGHIIIDLDSIPNPSAGDDTHVGEKAHLFALQMYSLWTVK